MASAQLMYLDWLKSGDDSIIRSVEQYASEARVLSKFLAVGLAEAAPDEDVTFAVIGMHRGLGVGLFGRDLFAKSQKATTGRVFYFNGRLNIIFGVIHKDIQQPRPAVRKPLSSTFPTAPSTRVARSGASSE